MKDKIKEIDRLDRKAKLYPSEELRNKLVELGVPRYKHNLAELGELLPTGYYTRRLFTDDNKKEEWIAILLPDSEYKETGFRAETEADARAKMLIYLIENDLMSHKQ